MSFEMSEEERFELEKSLGPVWCLSPLKRDSTTQLNINTRAKKFILYFYVREVRQKGHSTSATKTIKFAIRLLLKIGRNLSIEYSAFKL